MSYARNGSTCPQFSGPVSSFRHAVTDKANVTTTQHIVLSCTNRKRKGAHPSQSRLRDVPPAPLAARAAVWVEMVANAPTWGPARELYVGEYWQAGLDLARTSAGRTHTEVYVLSAGLGLVHLDAAVPGYGATFTRGHPDSVVLGDDESPPAVRRQWWAALAKWTGPDDRRGPRRLSELATSPGARLLVCAGPDYIDATADDLRAAHEVLGDDRLMIVGSAEPPEGLGDVWVQCPGQLRMRFGGSMSSTSVRLARAILEALGPAECMGARQARDFAATVLKDTQPLPRFHRDRLSDDDVLAWVRADAKAHPGTTNKTAALRRLRDEGRACEQSRFGRLYDAARGRQR